MKNFFWFLCMAGWALLTSCGSKPKVDVSSISTDSATIAKGHNLFSQTCSACHNFRQDGIGPRLSGITEELTAEHIKAFIRGPKTIIES